MENLGLQRIGTFSGEVEREPAPRCRARRTLVRARLLLLPLLAFPLFGQAAVSSSGHSRTQQLARMGALPRPEEVVVEDIVNYHRHGIPLPKAGESVALDLRWGAAGPSVGGAAILQVGVATPLLRETLRLPPLNLALVVDVSRTMGQEGKLVRVQEALRRFVAELRPEDRVSLVAYSDEAKLVADSLVGDGATLSAAVDALAPERGSNLHAGLMLGYRQVAGHFRKAGTNRVILLTDGIANVGIVEPDEIAAASASFNDDGMDLSTIGVGLKINQDLLRALAKGGRGLFHLIANAEEVERVFVKELQGLVAPVARHVQLELRIGPGLRLARTFGYTPTVEGSTVTFPLDDLNYGATLVVLLEFEAVEREPGACFVEARLGLTPVVPQDARVQKLVQRAVLSDSRGDLLEDGEVRKNYAIAVMAESMRQMAVESVRKQYARADAHLSRALAYCRANFPSTKDEDIVRVRAMVIDYQGVLARHLERFRGL